MADFSRQVSILHPAVRELAMRFLQAAADAGLDPRLQEGFRSPERQAELYAQGRTRPGAIVTKAGPGQSNHNYGVAFDVVPGAVIGKPNWDPENPAWAQLGQIGKNLGLEWGGDWKFTDRPHFQLANANWREMRNDPKFAHYAPQAPGTPAPAMSEPKMIAERPVAPMQSGFPPAPATPEPNQGGFGQLMASMLPKAAAAMTPAAQPQADFGQGDPMGATNAAFQGADMAQSLLDRLGPDIERLLSMGKRPVSARV